MIIMATAELDHSARATVLNEPGFLPHQEFTGCISADVAGKCVRVIGTGNATEESTFFPCGCKTRTVTMLAKYRADAGTKIILGHHQAYR